MSQTDVNQVIATNKAQLLKAQMTLQAYKQAIKGEIKVKLSLEDLKAGETMIRGQIFGLQQALSAAQSIKRGENPVLAEFSEMDGVRLILTPLE